MTRSRPARRRTQGKATRWRRAQPFLPVLTALLLAALFAWRTPRWQAPDEPAHYAYAATVARTGLPPVLEPSCYDEAYKNALVSSNFRQSPNLARFCYEGHQPPLFYYLAAPVFLASGGSLLALRLLCALVGAFVPLAAWRVVRRAGGDRALARAVAFLVALVPQHLAMLGALNNDALTFLLVALTVGELLGWEGKRQRAKGKGQKGVRLGVLLGSCLLTKTLGWVVLPLAGLALLFSLRPQRALRVVRRQARRLDRLATGAAIGNRKSEVENLLAALLLAALLVLPWFVRNVATYGGRDVMGLARHDAIAVGQPRTGEELARRGVAGTLANGAQTTFHSFWGQFGWMKAPLQVGEYRVLAAFSVLAAVGLLGWLARRGWRAWGLNGQAVALLAAWVAVNAALLLFYNLEFVQYQGRYLFPSLTALAFFGMVGLAAWLPRRARWLPWLALLAFLLYLDVLAITRRLPAMAAW